MELHGQKGKRPGSSHFLYIKKKITITITISILFYFFKKMDLFKK
jgi:hypothetical protein